MREVEAKNTYAEHAEALRPLSVLRDFGRRPIPPGPCPLTRAATLVRRAAGGAGPSACKPVVGPRPHAVAHNEQYRKLIDGYMVRHKVKPGITGWAQVNGFRGETEVLEKMKKRIDYDLDYLRNWSLRLDLFIVIKTLQVLIKDRHAY